MRWKGQRASPPRSTDARGRVCAKVRHGPLQVLVDVPETDLLLAWAAAPFQPLAGQVVFYNDAQARQPRESISFAAGQCVGYEEDFDAGTGGGGNGAYVCALTVTAPAFELHSSPALFPRSAIENLASQTLY